MLRNNQPQFVGPLRESEEFLLRSARYLTLYQKEFFENSRQDEP
jgi:hypothetical protein